MNAIGYSHCRKCETALRSRFPRKLGYCGPCRDALTDTELRAAMAGADPTPPAATASAAERPAPAPAPQPTTPALPSEPDDVPLCQPHGGVLGRCALCRRDDDPKRITDRVITEIQRLPMDQRIAAQRATAIRRYRPAAQLTIGA
ncbi:hypothetical protein [Actinoallomurus sp. CA-142502]|uniref:hypothetical protein n=1 Tax=Actinoallomurus sp. CA-142502 TaxID=3239885 RepID=UPI003D945A3D